MLCQSMSKYQASFFTDSHSYRRLPARLSPPTSPPALALRYLRHREPCKAVRSEHSSQNTSRDRRRSVFVVLNPIMVSSTSSSPIFYSTCGLFSHPFTTSPKPLHKQRL